MPPKNNSLPRLRGGGASSKPPEVMTRSKRMQIAIAAGVFDIVRAFFHLFWFFGPALAALYCTLKLPVFTFGLLGTKTAAAFCGITAAALGAAGVEATAPLGVVMADAVGFIAFLTLGVWVLMTNERLLKAARNAPLQFAAAFAISEVPFLGAFPVYSVILWRLYSTQIEIETAALKKWQDENANAKLQQRDQQTMRAAQIQSAQQTQFLQQGKIAQQAAANDSLYKQEQAENDDRYNESFGNVPGAATAAANDDEYTQQMDKAA